MRWKQSPPKRHPIDGDRRTRRTFLLIPKMDKETSTYRWLEFVEMEEVYQWIGMDGEGGSYYGWVCCRWIND